MNGSAAAILVIIVLIGVLVSMVYIQRWLTMRAARKVIRLFRKRGATSPTTATTIEEMGLVGSQWFRPFRMRDYRPYAARMLGQAKIIRSTEEGKVYLSEDDLEKSALKRRVNSK